MAVCGEDLAPQLGTGCRVSIQQAVGAGLLAAGLDQVDEATISCRAVEQRTKRHVVRIGYADQMRVRIETGECATLINWIPPRQPEACVVDEDACCNKRFCRWGVEIGP